MPVLNVFFFYDKNRFRLPDRQIGVFPRFDAPFLRQAQKIGRTAAQPLRQISYPETQRFCLRPHHRQGKLQARNAAPGRR